MNTDEGVKFARTSLIYQCCTTKDVKQEKEEKLGINYTTFFAQKVNLISNCIRHKRFASFTNKNMPSITILDTTKV